MSLDWLRIGSFRNLEAVEIHPAPGVNWFYGENGAGKTSVLEAVHVLGRGRSFRASSWSAVIATGAESLSVVAAIDGERHRLGVSRGRSAWQGRIDGHECRRVSEFARYLPLVLIEPGSHALIEGPPHLRRSYLDWGLFHVEPDYLERWRNYTRLLRQRNAALKDGAGDAVLEALESAMAPAAERLDRSREALVQDLAGHLEGLAGSLRLRFDLPAVAYRPGQEPDLPLADAWRRDRARDRELGHTRAGPHRADLRLALDGRSAAPRLSRGQQKLTSVAMLLARLEQLRSRGLSPLLLLDDPVSELDRDHLERLVAWLVECPVQSLVTAIEPPARDAAALFHVEQGRVARMV